MASHEQSSNRAGSFTVGAGVGFTNVSKFDRGVIAASGVAAWFAPTTARIRARSRIDLGSGLIGNNSFLLLDEQPTYDDDDVVVIVPAHQVDRALPRSMFVSERRTVKCEVEEILKDGFTAIYWDDDQGARRVRFSYDGLSEDDIERVVPRAEFHWTIGTEVREDGRKSTTSLILLRREPPISKDQWYSAVEKAKANAQLLGYTLLSDEDLSTPGGAEDAERSR